MKKVLGLTLLAVAMLGVSTASAQKFARINLQDIVVAMPEFDEMQKNLETFGKDLQEQMEQIQVEFNNKLADFQKNQATMAASIKQMKQQELEQLQQRFGEFQQIAQQDIQKEQQKLMTPIYEKVKNTIDEVAKAGGYTVILPGGALIYVDPAQVKDIAPEVKSKLGVTTPAAQ